ncbi:MAG: UvrB/UvrC motif-containing protein [Luteolibacter sp.]
MKCDFCETKATVFLTQLVEGQMKKVCLCEACAKERGVTDPTGFSLADFLQGGGGPIAGIAPAAQGTVSMSTAGYHGKVCPTCSFTLEDLRRVRRFGCSDCYSVFRDEVNQMLRGMHKGVSHIGKVPEGLMAQQYRHQRLEELRSKLDQAIASESYEEAAGIRDEIRGLETVSLPTS